MKIHLHHIIPAPLKEQLGDGSVWNRDTVFEPSAHYLVRADSGKGKSTLLNILYGIRKDYTGHANYGNHEVHKISDDEWSKIRSLEISYLFQDLRLFPALTAMENIQLKPGNILYKNEIEYYADKLGVSNQLKKPCSKLSLGQQQRIALIRALSQRFEWLFLDEPFSHLDKNNAMIAMECIMERCGPMKAGILATSLGDQNGFDHFQIIDL
ncbi:MAG: ATP-binding cassette domain-containing protein [Bacteroidetes bacterium]|nr:ATP-binding cassette domain-containing protein [Bacteroidota bacterium]